ncbi:MAG: trigger factor [Verrucomicrobia bacterium]|nr:MAG: trigger factor [Verrucomicrobiota bacterium]
MNIVVEKQPKCVATLRVEIPAGKVASERNQILRTYTNKARIPGFRPGKAPLAVVEKRYGKDIADELRSKLINEAYDEAIQQESLKVLEFGMAQAITDLPDGGLSFETTLMLAPDVQLPEYKGITVIVPPADLPEEELTQQFESLRERFADFQPVEDRAAAMGDFAVIDYSSSVNGQATEEFLGKPADYLAGRQDFWLRLDEGAFLPGFCVQLVGMNPGESREITVTLPEDFPIEELRSCEMLFSSSLKEIKRAILPDLDDALAARLAPGKSIEEITAVIRDNMQYERQRKINDMKVNQIVAHFNANVDFELPDELIAQETQTQADSMVERGIQAGMSEDEVQSQQAEIFATAQHQAVSNLRTNFILQEIARVENITVNDKELVGHLVQIAASRKLAPQKFIKDMQRSGRISNVRQSMTIGKAIDFLVEQAIVQEDTATPLND